jgi:hypothetical protein
MSSSALKGNMRRVRSITGVALQAVYAVDAACTAASTSFGPLSGTCSMTCAVAGS